VRQDDIGGVPIVLLADPGTWRWPSTVVGWRGCRPERRGRPGGGRVWLQVVGRRPGGRRSAQGTALRYVPSRVCEWYAWAALHPQTDVARSALASRSRPSRIRLSPAPSWPSAPRSSWLHLGNAPVRALMRSRGPVRTSHPDESCGQRTRSTSKGRTKRTGNRSTSKLRVDPPASISSSAPSW